MSHTGQPKSKRLHISVDVWQKLADCANMKGMSADEFAEYIINAYLVELEIIAKFERGEPIDSAL